jgi:hypothetical protein
MRVCSLKSARFIAGGLLVLAGVVAGGVAPSASAQTVCSDPVVTATCPIIINGGQTTSTSYITTYGPTGAPVYVAPAVVDQGDGTTSYAAPSYPISTYAAPTYVAPTYVTPTYVAPTLVSTGSTEPVITVGGETYVSMGGGYCSLPDGGQVWVPAGASAASYGC